MRGGKLSFFFFYLFRFRGDDVDVNRCRDGTFVAAIEKFIAGCVRF